VRWVERTRGAVVRQQWICDWTVLKKVGWASGTGLRRRVHFQTGRQTGQGRGGREAQPRLVRPGRLSRREALVELVV
jgi:hypothetical protein